MTRLTEPAPSIQDANGHEFTPVRPRNRGVAGRADDPCDVGAVTVQIARGGLGPRIDQVDRGEVRVAGISAVGAIPESRTAP